MIRAQPWTRHHSSGARARAGWWPSVVWGSGQRGVELEPQLLEVVHALGLGLGLRGGVGARAALGGQFAVIRTRSVRPGQFTAFRHPHGYHHVPALEPSHAKPPIT